jgi:type II secretory pathway pseudopilin PulG
LLEMTIALLIAALLLNGLIPNLSARIEQQRVTEARRQLAEIREALTGYAIAHGRLPCPAAPAGDGAESYAAGGNASNGKCANFYDGYAPAATLGLPNANGYALDPWHRRIRYAVAKSYTFSNSISPSSTANALQICETPACASGGKLTSDPGVPALIFSVGGNGRDDTLPASSADPPVFINHAPSVASSPQGEFDDIAIWLSPNTLYARMAEAGK